MSKTTALQTVQSFQTSLASGNDEWTDLVSENISFKGPVTDVKGKPAFIDLNKSFFPMVRAYEPINAFEQGNFACLEGRFKLATPKGNEIEVVMAEVYLVENGKIQAVRVYYDAEDFRKEFAN
jgi:limonene-1,2-epoxide hydrolase